MKQVHYLDYCCDAESSTEVGIRTFHRVCDGPLRLDGIDGRRENKCSRQPILFVSRVLAPSDLFTLFARETDVSDLYLSYSYNTR